MISVKHDACHINIADFVYFCLVVFVVMMIMKCLFAILCVIYCVGAYNVGDTIVMHRRTLYNKVMAVMSMHQYVGEDAVH